MKNFSFNLKIMILILSVSSAILSCENEFDLPEEGTLEDFTPPEASFSFVVDSDDFKTYLFGNESISATTYIWDYGDGNTSNGLDGLNTFAEEGTYTVTLTVEDGNGLESVFSSEVEVVEPEVPNAIIPIIKSPSFEDFLTSDPDKCSDDGDGKDCWDAAPNGTVIAITGSGEFIRTGDAAAKFDDGRQSRYGYQDQIAVTPNTDYILRYYYIIDTNGTTPSTFTNWIIADGTYADMDEVIANNLATVTVSDTGEYLLGTLTFNSGSNEFIGIAFSAGPDDGVGISDVYADDYSIEVVQ